MGANEAVVVSMRWKYGFGETANVTDSCFAACALWGCVENTGTAAEASMRPSSVSIMIFLNLFCIVFVSASLFSLSNKFDSTATLYKN